MTGLRARILAGERLAGCFGKTPGPQVAELPGGCPIGVEVIDEAVTARRSVGLLVMVASRNPNAAAIGPLGGSRRPMAAACA